MRVNTLLCKKPRIGAATAVLHERSAAITGGEGSEVGEKRIENGRTGRGAGPMDGGYSNCRSIVRSRSVRMNSVSR